MSAALFPEPDDLDSSGPGRDAWDEQGLPEQGLFITLPAEELSLEGFAEGGRADTMTPGPLLATVLGVVAGEDGQGLSGLGDDQLVGFLSGSRRMESQMAWARLAALAEFASRPRRDGFAADEVAAAFRMTWHGAARQIDYATTVTRRLPVSFAALGAGRIDPVHLAIIADETSILSDEDAAAADPQLAEDAQSKTYGELRAAARRLVTRLDAEAVRKRKERAKRDTSVRAFREESGNAGISAREMAPAEVLASMQHILDRARALRAAGVPGTWEELKARATLDLLQERDSRPAPDPTADQDSPGKPDDGPGGPDNDSGPGGNGPGGNGRGPGGNGPGGPGEPGSAAGPSLGALVTITVPWAALHGDGGTSAEVTGFGIVDHDDTRDLLAAAGRDARTRWCVTVLNPDGTAAAHGCAAGSHRWPPGQGPPGQGPPLPPAPADLVRALKITGLAPVIRGPCGHGQAEDRYRPSRRLTHIIRARNATCTAPGCSRPAASCDLDHTTPWHHGGPTCECNLAPLCRRHHRCKQSQGWKLEQPSPGVLRWRTPAGRTYTTTPTKYPR